MGVLAAAVVGSGIPGRAQAPMGRDQSASISGVLRSQLSAAMQKLASGTPAAKVQEEVEKLFDLNLAYGTPEVEMPLLIDLAVARRICGGLADPKTKDAAEVAPLLVANPDLAATLALSIKPEDDIPQVYHVLKLLHDKFPKDVQDGTDCAALVAAVCVVYDHPPENPAIGRSATPNDPCDIFEFFRSTKDRLAFRDKLPVELLIYVVDAHASIDELKWAQRAYSGNSMIGKVYSSIVYDTAAFKYGQEKKVMKDGYTLQNIRKVGGVCLERAYFASEVGKAIGVPAMMVTGEGSDVGHAWVGYLKSIGSRATWDFTEGRFGEYKQGRGSVEDPQTNKETSDAFVGMTEQLVGASRGTIRLAIARTDAARKLQMVAQSSGKLPTWPTTEEYARVTPPREPRAATMAGALAMLREALNGCPGYERGWRELELWAEKGELDAAQKKEWSEAVLKMAGRDRPDFAFEVLAAMFGSTPAGAEQSKLWDWAASEFYRRPDLVSAARLAQGRQWEKAGDNAKAWDAYKEVITKYPNDGRSIIHALVRAEALLKHNGKDKDILGLYEDAFRRISRPQQMSPGFETATNYYRVGSRYADLLEAAGKKADADRVKRQIGETEKKGAFGK
jgi:tetratricopeptide (TPR) repeat protein